MGAMAPSQARLLRVSRQESLRLTEAVLQRFLPTLRSKTSPFDCPEASCSGFEVLKCLNTSHLTTAPGRLRR